MRECGNEERPREALAPEAVPFIRRRSADLERRFRGRGRIAPWRRMERCTQDAELARSSHGFTRRGRGRAAVGPVSPARREHRDGRSDLCPGPQKNDGSLLPRSGAQGLRSRPESCSPREPFLRVLRVLRVKPAAQRSVSADPSTALGMTAECRSLDSLCSLGMTGTRRRKGVRVWRL